MEYCSYSKKSRFQHLGPKWRIPGPEVVEALHRGEVLVAFEGGSFRHLPGCKLERRFESVAPAEGATGELFASTRVLVRASEVPDACGEATHAVVAYLDRDGESSNFLVATVIPIPCSEQLIQDGYPGCHPRVMSGIPGYADEIASNWTDDGSARGIAAKLGTLLDIYPMDPPRVAPLLARVLATTPEPISCFIAAEARQQVEDPDGAPIEWTDPELEGCAAFPPFDVCYPDSFRPARLTEDQCHTVSPKPGDPPVPKALGIRP